MKQIYDPVHGFIQLTPLMIKIIDTPEFQRLRDLKQLGATYLVFPSATHSRLEHSIGVAHLAGETMRSLHASQPELQITPRLIELVQIAGLIHDLGHGPFSHLYDHYVRPTNQPEHEERGCQIFTEMITTYSIPIGPEEVTQILRMICPKPEDKWIYEIVANAKNQIDVDKIDYIIRDCYHLGLQTGGEFKRIITQCRVIDDTICYPHKVQYDIYALFAARYRLHKQVYHHHAVIAYEFIIVDILKEIMQTNPPFCDLTDAVVNCRLHSKFRKRQNDIAQRKHWRMVIEKRYNQEDLYKCDNDITEIKACKNADTLFKVHRHTIGFVSGNKSNPLENIWFYANSNPTIKYKLPPQEAGFIVPKQYQETIMRVYIENKEQWDTIKEELL
jgi:HD superfamily phosphohydrolase